MENPTNYTLTDDTSPSLVSGPNGLSKNALLELPWVVVEDSHGVDALDGAFAQIPLAEHKLNDMKVIGYLFNSCQFNNLVVEISRSPRVHNFISFKVPPSEVDDVKADGLEGFCKFVYKREVSPNMYFINYKDAKLETIVFSIIHKKIANFYRSRKFKAEPLNLLTTSAAEDPFNAVTMLEELWTLKDFHQQALLLRYQYGLGVDEIAAVMGRTYKGAESLLSRARKELEHAYQIE